MSDIFGPIVVGTQIEEAVMSTLRTWMPEYIQEIELQLGRQRGQIPTPRQYVTRKQFEGFPDDKMPLCVVASPGLADPPHKEGDGTYSAWWIVGTGFAAAARDAEAAGFLSKLYGAAARKILIDHGSLGGFAEGTEWVDESYDDDLEAEEDKTVRACYDAFRVYKYEVMVKGGPVTPPDPVNHPGSQWPTADIVRIDQINPLS